MGGTAEEGKLSERTHMITTSMKLTVSSKFMALWTVPVHLTSGSRRVKVNALQDEGSSRSDLNNDVAAELGFEARQHELTVKVLNDNHERIISSIVEFTISSLDGRVHKPVSAYMTERVTGNMAVCGLELVES